MNGRVVVGLAALIALAAAASVGAANPTPAPKTTWRVQVWGQASSSDESFDRPLGSTLALFAKPAKAVSLPAPSAGRIGISLATVAAHMTGRPGKLVLAKARRVVTPVGSVYLVPTTRGWLCIQGPTFGTCHRGLLPAGVTWSFWSSGSGIGVIGVAANDVARVELAGDGRVWTALLRDNVFVVSRPVAITSVQNLPPLGTLVVAYRDHRRPVRVPLR